MYSKKTSDIQIEGHSVNNYPVFFKTVSNVKDKGMLSFHHMRTQRKDSHPQPGRDLSSGAELSDTLILDCPTSTTVKHNCTMSSEKIKCHTPIRAWQETCDLWVTAAIRGAWGLVHSQTTSFRAGNVWPQTLCRNHPLALLHGEEHGCCLHCTLTTEAVPWGCSLGLYLGESVMRMAAWALMTPGLRVLMCWFTSRMCWEDTSLPGAQLPERSILAVCKNEKRLILDHKHLFPTGSFLKVW